MALISNGIDRVQAYALPAGVRSDGNTINEPLSVLVSWQSIHDDKLHQIYINGKLCGLTEDVFGRQAVVAFSSSWESVIRIEVFAVEPIEGINDYSSELEYRDGNRVRVSWIKNAAIPLESVVDIFSNDGSGDIDFQEPVQKGLPCWSIWQDKWGFGLSGFGVSDFGYDGAGAVGFGRGYFGGGEFGFDAEESEWISGELKAGEYRFGIKIRDCQGNVQEVASESGPVTVLPSMKGAVSLRVKSYDADNNLLVLAV
jgi:hypothetical protein